ncbi:hypothetical protein BDN72DRAFT_926049 [Pluteus cervinus]|uniref:Uncharacterized protein n=1 Tax=Pluteus cervinus TaxID=181527 RepID=A0ACD3B3Z5_9AGAR|nr:hypothetical protein BDN72DRAFT_926049 [Pluteus cervinus]
MATNYTTEVNGQASINIGAVQVNAPFGTFTTIANQTTLVQNVPKLELVVTGISLDFQDGSDASASHFAKIWSVVDGQHGNTPIFEGWGERHGTQEKWNMVLGLPIEQVLWLKFWGPSSFLGDFYICLLDVLTFCADNPVGGTVLFEHPMNLRMSIHLDENTLHNLLDQIIPGPSLTQALLQTKPVVALLVQMLSPSPSLSKLFSQAQESLHFQELFTRKVFDLVVDMNSIHSSLCEIQKVEIQQSVQDDLSRVSNFAKNVLFKLWNHTKLAVQDQIRDNYQDSSFYTTLTNIQEVKRNLETKTFYRLKEYEEILEKLQHAAGRFEFECLPDTRVEILAGLLNWANNGAHTMLWLSGGAGTGKSTIAASFAKQLPGAQLAGYHTCRRGSQTLESAVLLVQNLCYQLANVYQPFKVKVSQEIITEKLFTTKEFQIKDLFKLLFYDPISRLGHSIYTGTALVLVIDALDECGSENNRIDILKGLHDLSLCCNWIKIFITSRPNHEIENFIQQHRVSKQNLTPEQSVGDVDLFMKHRLGGIPDIVEDIAQLIEYAAGLFIWAQTACNYIMKKFNKVLAVKQIFKGHPEHEAPVNLYYLYTIVLEDAIGGDPDNVQVYNRVMSAILLAAEAIDENTILELTSTVEFGKSVLKEVLNRLGPILYVGQDGKYYVLHPSFRDYATGNNYSRHFYIPAENHLTLLKGALNVMEEELTFNICNLETSYKLNTEVVNLSEKIKNKISGALKYSSVYWPYHILQNNSTSDICKTDLTKFCKSVKILYWIEVLSLLGNVRRAILDVTKVESLLLVKSKGLYEELEDICSFLSKFEYCISESTPHLYVSALALAPGGHIVSGSYDKTVRIWNAQTGMQVDQPLQGHTEGMTSASFSPDSRHIVSGSHDKTVRIWNAQTGMQVGQPLQGHTNWVTSVSFSPDGRHIVSGSHDKTVRIWNAQTGMQVGQPLQGHTDWVTSVSFSPDSRHIVSGSHDKTVRIWDAQMAMQVGQPLQAHPLAMTPVPFSPEGRDMGSGSCDQTQRTWSNSIILPSSPHSYLPFQYTSPSSSFLQDGWYQVNNMKLLWIPPIYRETALSGELLCIPTNPQRQTLYLNWNTFVHGDQWHHIHTLS